ncbi:MAG: hypothetical protein AB1706_19600, partial [Pseudomonadota bacterium]
NNENTLHIAKTSGWQTTQTFPHLNITTLPSPSAPHTMPLMPELFQSHGAQKQIVAEESYALIGQLWNTYIIIEKDEEVIFIDQHAAHERIWYERYKKNFTPEQGTVLLFPEELKLTHHQAILLMQHKSFFNRHGIDFELNSEGNVFITTCPPFLKSTSLRELVQQAAEFIADHEYANPESFDSQCNDHMHAQMACKRAIKAGDILTPQQMHQLIKDLQQVEHRFICAHGRPTIWTLSKNSLEKHFRRC